AGLWGMSLSYAWPQTNGSEPFRNHTLAQWLSLAGRCAASSTLTQPDSGPRSNSELGFNDVSISLCPCPQNEREQLCAAQPLLRSLSQSTLTQYRELRE